MFPTRLSFPDDRAFLVLHRPHDCRENLHFDDDNAKHFDRQVNFLMKIKALSNLMRIGAIVAFVGLRPHFCSFNTWKSLSGTRRVFHPNSKNHMKSNRLFGSIVLAIAFAGSAPLSVASAGVLYQTGFDAPDYSSGNLAGQNGWNGSTDVKIGETPSDSWAYISGPVAGQQLAGHNISYSSVGNTDQVVEFTVDFGSFTNSTTSIFDVLGVGSSAGFLGQLLVVNGFAKLGLASTTVGAVAITPDVYSHFVFDFDFASQIQTAYVNGTFIGSGAFAAAATDLTRFSFGQNSGNLGAGNFADWDNLKVTSVPEPESLALFGIALAGLGVTRRKAKQV